MLGVSVPSTGESGKPLKQRRHVDLAKAQKKLYMTGERKLLNPVDSKRKLN